MEAEFRERVRKAQARMEAAGLSSLLLTTEPEVRYFTGFLTRFWESPTRPWFVVVPVSSDPIAVIPAIGKPLMVRGWISDIRTWNSPDYEDDGIGLLAETIRECVPSTGRIGIARHAESHVRMPLSSFDALVRELGDRDVCDDAGITSSLRAIKSEAEIAKIRHAVSIADRAFDRVSEIAATGVPLSTIFRRFQALCLEEGADWVPYLAGAAGQGGYADVISPATDDPIADSDVLMLDTGLVWDGYFCDFDRNFSIGEPSLAVADAHRRLVDASTAAFESAKPGTTMAALFEIMDRIVSVGPSAGRLGHGLGMQLTEGASIHPADHTVLEVGMVLTLEPYVGLADGKIMVHEENIVIRDGGAEYLSSPAEREIVRLC